MNPNFSPYLQKRIAMNTLVNLRHVLFVLILLSSFSVAAIEPFPSGTDGKLFTVEGSNTVGAKLAPNWVKSWMEAKGATNVSVEPQKNPNEYRVSGTLKNGSIYVDLHAHGSTTGFKGLLVGTADIAMASRGIKSSEVSALSATYGDMHSLSAEHVVAIDGLAIIANSQNPVDSLSVSQIARIFSGEINNWADVGGANRAISIYARDSESGTWDTFKNLVLAKTYTLSEKAQRFESNDELSDSVSSDAGGIGFVGLASVRKSKAMAINENNTTPLKPEVIYVATEDYALSRRLYMYTPEQPRNTFVTDFIEYAHGEAGQTIVEKIGFISQNPIKSKVAELEGPKEYQQLARYAERLSVNFRFKAGASSLDNKAKKDIIRLTNYLKSNKLDKLKIQLVGFSDSEDSDNRAEVLSRLRASAVKIALFRNGIKSEPVLGYGSDLLVANSNGSGSGKNSRVEVWLY